MSKNGSSQEKKEKNARKNNRGKKSNKVHKINIGFR